MVDPENYFIFLNYFKKFRNIFTIGLRATLFGGSGGEGGSMALLATLVKASAVNGS
jgi:hypothetical protein